MGVLVPFGVVYGLADEPSPVVVTVARPPAAWLVTAVAEIR